MINIFLNVGPVKNTCYLFLGNYVNRGKQSLRLFLLLICMKLRYPENVVLLRGNHESRMLTYTYGFYDECRKLYGCSNVWRYCSDLFDYLSLAAIIDMQVFCVHGGISDNCLIDDIYNINRIKEVP
jgi:Calcineurin-like phosphoesterase